jgi:hypothetical protein
MAAIGVQNSVIAFDDPFHSDACGRFMRTGEGRLFPSQEPAPAAEHYVDFLRGTLEADFLVQHVVPADAEIERFIDAAEGYGMPYILGNEFGNINGPHTAGTNRYDIPPRLVERAARGKAFRGLLYDETEHLQMHPGQYTGGGRLHQWLNPTGRNFAEAEEAFVESVRGFKERIGCEVWGEHVFPSLLHLFARGGFGLAPKLLKEEFQSVQLAVAMGAAKQYRRNLCYCVDLWGMDVGPWFTRLWGFPAHSPREFESALYLAHYTAPHGFFVENGDALMRSEGGKLRLTEFGEIFTGCRQKIKSLGLPYSIGDLTCRIAVVSADDGCFAKSGAFDGAGGFGFRHLPLDARNTELIDVLYALSHGSVSRLSLNQHKSELSVFPAAAFERAPENLKRLPLLRGAETESLVHPIFYPMNSVLVFDDQARYEDIETAEAVIVCGSRLSGGGRAAVAEAGRRGARIFAARHLNVRAEGLTEITDFAADLPAALGPLLGDRREWVIGYGRYDLAITNPSGDGKTLSFAVRNAPPRKKACSAHSAAGECGVST